jgi:thymidine kinase
MAKLYFRYGAVGSAKTMNLIAVAYSYKEQDKRTLVIKPSMDIRFGAEVVKSRAGLELKADLLVDEDTELHDELFDGVHCVLVDEAQFIPPRVIEQLRHVASALNVPVMAYWLRQDFRSQLFAGSKRLLELADKIEEVKSTCQYCNAKACLSLRTIDGVGTVEGEQVVLGCEMYVPVCYPHFYEKTQGSPMVGGLESALTIGQALEKALAPKVDDNKRTNRSRSRSRSPMPIEPDQEQTPEKLSIS